MAKLVKPWGDGGNLYATYDGSGNGTAVFSTDIAEGLDREMEVKFVAADIVVTRTIKQSGMREMFVPADGEFILSDGGTFNVLKNS